MKVISFSCDEYKNQYSVGLENGRLLTGFWAARLIYLKPSEKNCALSEPHIDLSKIREDVKK